MTGSWSWQTQQPEIGYRAEYLGGHELFPKNVRCHLVLNPDNLEIPEMALSIPYKDMEDVRSMTGEQVSAWHTGGGAALGLVIAGPLGAIAGALVGHAIKARKHYMTLTYKDEASRSHSMVLDVQGIEAVQPAIYRRMIEAKKQEQ